MCARARRQPRGSQIDPEQVHPSWTDLGEWIRAWRSVMRDPDKTIPEPGLGPEGDPIPVDLDLHCPNCSYSLAGLEEWRCPECGEPFNPRRVYTQRMLRVPEYFLRYRYDPDEIRRSFYALLLTAAGLILLVVGALVSARGGGRSGVMSVRFGLGALSGFSFLTVPTLILLHFAADIPWPRIFFYFALPWFAMCALLFAAFVF